jgi:hypothetical protein
LGEESWLLLIATHHILADAWSTNLLFAELASLYAALAAGQAAPPPPSLHYADFAHWQRRTYPPEALVARQAYWQGLLSTPPPPLELTTDHPRPAEQGEQTYPAASERLALPAGLVRRLKALGRSQDATFYAVLLAGYAALLHRRSGSTDIVIGAPTSKRAQPELEQMLGHFTGRSWLRIDLAGKPGFAELLARTKQTALAALENQYLTLRQWLTATQGHTDWRPVQPLQARATFNLWPSSRGEVELPGLAMALAPASYGVIHTDVALNVWEEATDAGPVLHGFWLYRRDLFEPATIAAMALNYQRLLTAAAADPAQPIGDLPLPGSGA